MLRILLPAFLVLSLAGCSTNSSRGSVAGYTPADNKLTNIKSSAKSRAKRLGRAGGARTTRRADLAPAGSFKKARKGTFSHKVYRKTALKERVALEMINSYRASKGLKPLRLNKRLTRAAKTHALDLARNDRISHHGSDGSDPWERVKRSGYKPRLAAENVGTGQASLAEVFKGWKESPGHNANLLLPDATQMGIYMKKQLETEYKTFWVLELGAPIS